MIVGVQAEAGDGLGDDAFEGEGEVVGALEEELFGVGVGDKVGAVTGELGTEVGALVAGKPEGAGGDGGIGAADHFELEVGDDAGEGDGRVVEKGSVAVATDLF